MSKSNRPPKELSPQELKIVVLASEGLVDKEIATTLGVAVGTVRTHWTRIRAKLSASSRAKAVAIVLTSGLDNALRGKTSSHQEGIPVASSGFVPARAVPEPRETDLSPRLFVQSPEPPSVVFWEADAKTRTVTFVSPEVEAMFGYPTEKWIKTTFWQSLVHPEDTEKICPEVSEWLADQARCTSEYRIRSADRRWVWVRSIATLVKGPDEQPDRLMGVYVDITDHKDQEWALQKREAELRQAVLALVERASTDESKGVIASLDRVLKSFGKGDPAEPTSLMATIATPRV